MLRVVSLLPSATEIVCALGCESWLVGRSSECDFPETIRNLPVCVQPAVDSQADSATIDRTVREGAKQGLPPFQVDSASLRSLRPDVILTQSLNLPGGEEAIRNLFAAQGTNGAQIIALAPSTIADVWDSIMTVATALHVPDRGFEVTSRLQGRMTGIINQSLSLMARPRVACITWVDPLIATSHWIPELVEMAGAKNLFGKPGDPAGLLSWKALVEADPDIIVAMPCGLTIERARHDMCTLSNEPQWWDLRAARNHRVFVADGRQFFTRPGPRLVESLEILAEIFHPHEFQFGHCDTLWQVL